MHLAPYLEKHLFLSGDYSTQTQAEQGWPPAQSVAGVAGTGRKGARQSAPAHLLDSAYAWIEGALGNGASLGTSRDANDLYDLGALTPSTASDAARLYRAHPCKASTPQTRTATTVGRVVAAGLAGSIASLFYGVPIGTLAGATVGLLIGTGKALFSGALAGIAVGTSAGLVAGVGTVALLCVGWAYAATYAALTIAKARKHGPEQRDVSRDWEEMSGGMALAARQALNLFKGLMPSGVTGAPFDSAIAPNSAAHESGEPYLNADILGQVLENVTPSQRYAWREVNTVFYDAVSRWDDIGVMSTKRKLSKSPKEIALSFRDDDESGHINPIFDRDQRHLFVGEKRSMHICSLVPSFDADAGEPDKLQSYRPFIEMGPAAPFFLQRRPLLDVSRPFVGDGTKIRQVQVSPMHRYRTETRLGTSFYYEENTAYPRRTTGKTIETFWGAKALFFAQDEYLVINNAQNLVPELYRATDMDAHPEILPFIPYDLPANLRPDYFNQVQVRSASMNKARNRLAMTTENGVLHVFDRRDDSAGKAWAGRHKFFGVESASFYPNSDVLLASVQPETDGVFALAYRQAFANNPRYTDMHYMTQGGLFNISSDTAETTPLMLQEPGRGDVSIKAVSPDESLAVISGRHNEYSLFDITNASLISIDSNLQREIKARGHRSTRTGRNGIQIAPTTNRIFFTQERASPLVLDRVGGSLALRAIEGDQRLSGDPRIGFTHTGDLIAIRRVDKVTLYAVEQA